MVWSDWIMLKPPEFDNFRNICFRPYFPHCASHPSPNPAPWIFGQQIILPLLSLVPFVFGFGFFFNFSTFKKRKKHNSKFWYSGKKFFRLDQYECQLTKTHSSLGKLLQRPIQTCLYDTTYVWTEQSLVPRTFPFIIFSKKYEDLCYFSCTNTSLCLGFKPDQLDKKKDKQTSFQHHLACCQEYWKHYVTYLHFMAF